MRLQAYPLTLAEANALILAWHRHNEPVVGHRFSIGARDYDRTDGAVVVGRPVARKCDQANIAEVTRLVTDGTPNACSFLYARAAQAAEAMGFHSIQTYTLPDEGGASLRAAGWTLEATTDPSPNGWHSRPQGALFPSNTHRAATPAGPKWRWRRVFARNLPRAAGCGTLSVSEPPGTMN